MSRSSDYFLATAEHKGASLFPSGLIMYDLPSSRRRTSRCPTTDPDTSTHSISSRKRSSTPPLPSSSSSSSSSIVDEEESMKNTLTTSEDWWKQAIEPMVNVKPISTSQSAFSMFDGDDERSMSSHQPPCSSSQRVIVHNRPLLTLTEISSDQALSHVRRWYERQSMPSLNLLIKRGLLKPLKEKSIRMSIGSKKFLYAQLDQYGKVLSAFDHRQFDSIEQFYRNYQSRRKQSDSLVQIYQTVRWYEQSFHSILLEYAESIVKSSGLQTRLIQDDELFDHDETMDKEILAQIDCWIDGRSEIDL